MSQVIKEEIYGEDAQVIQKFQYKKEQSLKFQQNKNQQQKIFGHWNNDENIKYLVFVRANKKLFEQNQQRKVWKIYKVMSLYIETRNVYQCRNHHQKMVQKYQTLQNLIEELENLYSAKNIKKVAKNYALTHQQSIQQFTPKRIRRSNKLKPVKTIPEIPKIQDSLEKKSEEKNLQPTVQNQVGNVEMSTITDPTFTQTHQLYQYLQVVAYWQQLQYMNACIQYFSY